MTCSVAQHFNDCFSAISENAVGITQLTVPGNQTLDELTPLNVSASATDADLPLNPLTVSLISPPKGMTINTADVEAFRRLAQDKVWPAYKAQFPEMWEEIVATKV